MKNVWSNKFRKAFFALVGPPDENGCRRWLGKINGNYGYFNGPDGLTYKAHKLALCIKTNQPYVRYQDMQPKLHAAHGCFAICGEDHPWCVGHISWLTPQQHGEDRRLKGQMPSGASHPRKTAPEKWEHLKGPHPELKATRTRGDQHWTRLHPEKVGRGDKHPNAKLTTSQKKLIAKKYATGLFTLKQLAKEFNVSFGRIHQLSKEITS